MYYTDMAPTRGSDGHTYLDQDFGLTKPTGYRIGHAHPRGPLSKGFGLNTCSSSWSSFLINFGSNYMLASGNQIQLGGWAKGL
jgi:hypothetical protein